MGEVRPIVAGEKKYRLPPIPARNWAPPEVIPVGAKPEVYTTASEVYGLTIVLCEVIFQAFFDLLKSFYLILLFRLPV
jgi:hypothetical protein